MAVYYGTTVSLERYEQSLGRMRSTKINTKTAYTLSYHQTVEEENAFKRDALLLELISNNQAKLLSIS